MGDKDIQSRSEILADCMRKIKTAQEKIREANIECSWALQKIEDLYTLEKFREEHKE